MLLIAGADIVLACKPLLQLRCLLNSHEWLVACAPMLATVPKQVNKKTAPELLRNWRAGSKAHPVDVYIQKTRVVHMRNWLINVREHLLHDWAVMNA